MMPAAHGYIQKHAAERLGRSRPVPAMRDGESECQGRLVCCCCMWIIICIFTVAMFTTVTATPMWLEAFVTVISASCCLCFGCAVYLSPSRVEPLRDVTKRHGRQVWSSVMFGSVTSADPDFQLMEVESGTGTARRPVKTALGKVSVKSKPCIPEPTCACCLDDFSDEDVVARLPCGHVFHEECLMLWVLSQERPRCPMCRSRAAAARSMELVVVDIP